MEIKHSLKTGLGFGLTSAIITTLGLMVGLYSSTNSKVAVLGGILTIAIADAFSDALGIHISEEYKGSDNRHVWESTIYTFLTKLIFASIFIIPVLIFSLKIAIIFSIIFGLVLLSVFSYFMAINKKEKPLGVIFEHVFIAILVILVSQGVGFLVNKYCC